MGSDPALGLESYLQDIAVLAYTPAEKDHAPDMQRSFLALTFILEWPLFVFLL